MRVISQDDFNPRSREGSDEVTDKWMILKNYFNPRSREGSDHMRMFMDLCNKHISIRAPAKGATAILYNNFHFFV